MAGDDAMAAAAATEFRMVGLRTDRVKRLKGGRGKEGGGGFLLKVAFKAAAAAILLPAKCFLKRLIRQCSGEKTAARSRPSSVGKSLLRSAPILLCSTWSKRLTHEFCLILKFLHVR